MYDVCVCIWTYAEPLSGHFMDANKCKCGLLFDYMIPITTHKHGASGHVYVYDIAVVAAKVSHAHIKLYYNIIALCICSLSLSFSRLISLSLSLSLVSSLSLSLSLCLCVCHSGWNLKSINEMPES
jgi:hypothetical protein